MRKNSTRPKCDSCEKKSIITLPYGPHYFCQTHFNKFFENRFKRTIRKYELFKPKEKLLVALSGGKDSCVLLHLLSKHYSKSNPISALIIDEGVRGYREKAISTAKELCVKNRVEYKVISFSEEFSTTNDELMPLILKNPSLGGTCAFCGTLRRNILNKYSKKLGADKLLTGHNLDDEVQSFVMNVFNNDFERLKRMNATSGVIDYEGFVKRIKPLYETPEKEILVYASLNKIKHYSKECCPYAWTAKRNEYREMLNNFESRFPGTHYSILRFFEKLKPLIRENPSQVSHNLHECVECGEPTEKKYCKACELINKIKLEKEKKVKPKK